MKFGFKLVGVFQSIGFKLGQWRDVSWYTLQLAAPEDGKVPEEPHTWPEIAGAWSQ